MYPYTALFRSGQGIETGNAPGTGRACMPDPKSAAGAGDAMIDMEQRLQQAEQVIREAGRLASGFYDNRGELTIKLKGVQDFVSQADAETEDLIDRKSTRLNSSH